MSAELTLRTDEIGTVRYVDEVKNAQIRLALEILEPCKKEVAGDLLDSYEEHEPALAILQAYRLLAETFTRYYQLEVEEDEE